MKTFQSAKWDLDAENDTFQELFQKSKKKNKVIDNQKKKAKKQIRELKKKINNNDTDETVNLIKTKNDFNKNKKRKIKFREQSTNKNQNSKHIDAFNLKTSKNIDRPIKSKFKVSNDETINIQNDYKLLKNKKKKLKKLKDKVSKNLINTETNGMKNKSKKNPKDVSSESDAVKKNTQNLSEHPKTSSLRMKKKAKFVEKLKGALRPSDAAKKPAQTLRQKMMDKLKAARFRFINEQIYTADGKEAKKLFQDDPGAFRAYHDGYRKQVRSWPMNPLDVVIDSVKKMPKTHVIADFGCGDAKLSKSVAQKVHSFDLVAADDTVVACDMSKVPLENHSVDVAVFCLSLMGTNLRDYLFEANRVLKVGGVLKVAEVESRFENVEDFVKGVQYFGFKNTWKDLSHNLFYFLDFKKDKNIANRNKLPTLSLLPCLYKKR